MLFQVLALCRKAAGENAYQCNLVPSVQATWLVGHLLRQRLISLSCHPLLCCRPVPTTSVAIQDLYDFLKNLWDKKQRR